MPPRKTTVIRKLREICLALPDSTEEEKWGKSHFCMKGKIFAGVDDVSDNMTIGFKTEMEDAKHAVQIPGIEKAPYVGHKGWGTIDPRIHHDWEQLNEWIVVNYCPFAPKRSRNKLDEAME